MIGLEQSRTQTGIRLHPYNIIINIYKYGYVVFEILHVGKGFVLSLLPIEREREGNIFSHT
jgi:hypothetical protein